MYKRQLLDIDSGRIITHLPFQAPLMRAGWIERSKLLWGATEDGTILFWDITKGTLQLTVHTLRGNRYFAVAPGGRYDSNLSADTSLLRWVCLLYTSRCV